jgi:hypothetical protein
LYVLGYLASVFGNSVSMLIAMLSLSGHSNGYQATIAVIRNNDNRRATGNRLSDSDRRVDSDRRINGIKRTNNNREIDSYRKS